MSHYKLSLKVQALIFLRPVSNYHQLQYRQLVHVAGNFQFHLTCRILPVDLSDPVATRAATEKAKELFGQIDILINNAGTCNYTPTFLLWALSHTQVYMAGYLATNAGVWTGDFPLVDMQESTHRKLMEVDQFAPWILTHDVLPGEWSQNDMSCDVT